MVSTCRMAGRILPVSRKNVALPIHVFLANTPRHELIESAPWTWAPARRHRFAPPQLDLVLDAEGGHEAIGR